MKSLLKLGVSVSLCAGCAGDPEPLGPGAVFVADERFDDRELALMSEAFAEVCEATDAVCPVFAGGRWEGGDPEPMVGWLRRPEEVRVAYRVDVGSEFYESFAGPFVAAHNRYSFAMVGDVLDAGEEGVIEPDDYWRLAALHELAHLMGAEHGDGQLMDVTQKEACLDAATLAVVCQNAGCGPGAHQTCPEIPGSQP